MENAAFSTEENFSIGDLAEIYGISSRTLRHYHDLGLFVPDHIDPRTGYRFYSRSQFSRLEMILQMRTAGLSLKQISDMLHSRDISMFEAILNEQINILEEKILEETTLRSALYQQLNSCQYVRNPPVQDKVFIEFIPKRMGLMFDIDQYDLRKSYTDGSPWEDALRKIKQKLLDNDLSLAVLNRKICCMISKQDLEENRLLCSGAVIFTDEGNSAIPLQPINSGLYACIYKQYNAMDNQSESDGLCRLLEYIGENNYTITGPYLGEIVLENSVFDYMSKSILVKLQIPIKLKND